LIARQFNKIFNNKYGYRMKHQFIVRETGEVADEQFYHDRLVNYLYSIMREEGSLVYRLVTSKRLSSLMAWINYDFPAGKWLTGGSGFLESSGIDTSEFYDPLDSLNTARKFFERKIRYMECRPMPLNADSVVAPADSRIITGSFASESLLFLKEKFFSLDDLLDAKRGWSSLYRNGDYAIFRLTPDKYHYSHVPVSGIVLDFYEIDGAYNSCNPGAVLAVNKAYSRNRRVVTIIDTDVRGGTGCGKVAMIEVAALMIGDIVQCYSEWMYETPAPLIHGMFLNKGQPKSLFRPGSSVDILIFENGRVKFDRDLIENSLKTGIETRYMKSFTRPVVETEIKVRSSIGKALRQEEIND